MPMHRGWMALLALVATIAVAGHAEPLPGKFSADNARLMAQRADATRVVFIGDSITSGWAKFAPAMFADASRINRGIAGQTTTNMRARFAADVVALRPAVVHILAGTNDIAGKGGPMTLAETQANISFMASAAVAAGARVVIGTVLPTADYYWRPGQKPVPKIAALNDWIRSEAARRSYVLAEYYQPLAAADGSLKPAYSKDGVHPNQAGYAVMRPIGDAAIKQALQRAR